MAVTQGTASESPRAVQRVQLGRDETFRMSAAKMTL